MDGGRGSSGVAGKQLSALFSVPAAVSSVQLNPLASLSVSLFCGDEQMQVSGPVQISLPLKTGLRLRAADTVPAWAFNVNTGKKAVGASMEAGLELG